MPVTEVHNALKSAVTANVKPEQMAVLESYIDEAANATKTDTWSLACRMLSLLEQMNKGKPPKQPPSGEGEGEGQEGKGGSGVPGGQGKQLTRGQAPAGEQSLANAAAKSLGNMGNTSGDNYAPLNMSAGDGGPEYKITRFTTSQYGSNDDLLLKASAESRKLSQVLRRKLIAMARTTRSHAYVGTRVDGRRLYKAAMPKSAVFRTVTKGMDTNAFVGLLLDASGSMASNHSGSYYGNNSAPADVATQAAWCICEALDGLPKVETAAVSYTGSSSNTQLFVLKNAADKAFLRKTAFTPLAMGGTPTGKALLWMVEQAKKSKRTRKLIILATDGAAGDDNMVQQAMLAAKQSGIEIMVIGIMTQPDRRLYPKASVVNNIKELPTTVVKIISQAFFDE